MTYIPYHTPLRSSEPMQQWRREADARESKRRAVAAASRRRSQVAQQQSTHSATATAERSAQAQFVALRSELTQQHEIMREAMIEFLVNENADLRADIQRLVKRARAEIEDSVERKTAAFRPPTVRGTYDATKVYSQHDLVIQNGGSYIARKDDPGLCPGGGWQQLTQPGKTGAKGERGFAGERGPQGASGANFIAWKIDKRNYVATPLMSDGKIGPPLCLREFFEEFFAQTSEQTK